MVNYDTHAETQVEETTIYGKTSLVVIPDWSGDSHWFRASEDQRYPVKAPLTRHCISGRHTASHQEDGGDGETMEMLQLQTNGESQSRVLPTVWQTLDQMLRSKLHSAGTILGRMGLGEIDKFQCQKEEQPKQITTGSWARTQRKRWESWWKRQRHHRQIKGWEWKARHILFDNYGSITIHPVPKRPAIDRTLDRRDWQRAGLDSGTTACPLSQCGPGGSPSQGISQSRTNAHRGQGVDREDPDAGGPVLDPGPPCRNIQSGQGPQASDGNSRSQEDAQSCLAVPPKGIGRPLESPTSRLHGTTSRVDGERKQGDSRHTSCQQGHTEFEFQSSRCHRWGGSRTIGPSAQGRTQQGFGGRGPQEEIAQGLRGVRSHCRSDWNGDPSRSERWRRGRRSQEEKSEVNRASRKSRWQNTCCLYVIFGCASTCPLVNASHTKPLQVSFDPVVEAYDTLGCCAASYSFENASAFPFQDWIGNEQIPPPEDFPTLAAYCFEEALECQRRATVWRFMTLSESFGFLTPPCCLEEELVTPFDFDKEQQGGPLHRHRLLDNWQEDTRLQQLGDEETQQDQPIAEEPILIIEEWEALLRILEMQTDIPTGLTLIMHGLFQSDVGLRETQVAPDIEDIRAAVLRSWDDFFHPGITGFLHIVRPQDDPTLNTLRVIVEMSGAGVMIPTHDVATLRRTHWSGIEDTEYTQSAAYHTPGINNFELFAQTDLANWCLVHQSYQCNVHIERRILLPLTPANIQPGSLIDIFVHQRGDNEETDDTNLIQAHKVQVQDSLIPHVFDRCCGEGEKCHSDPYDESNKWGWHLNPRGPSSALVDLSWNCRDEDSIDGGVRSFKPNPGILEGIDATVPYRHRTQDGFVFTGRTIPPPHWEQHPLLRSAANYGAVHRNLDGELTVLIRSWIVARQEHMVLQHRDFTIRAQLMHEVESKIRQFWPDYIIPDDPLTLTRVRPAPNIGHRGQKPLHILVEVNREDGSTWQPILMASREINEQGPSNVIRWTPALVQPNIDMPTVHALCAPPCDVQQMLIPLPGRVRRWLVLGQNRPATPGLFLPLWWDQRLQVPQGDAYEEDDQQALLQGPQIDISLLHQKYLEQDEAVSLMQQVAPSQSPSLKQIRLHGLHCHLATILIDSEQTLMEAVAESWPYGQRQHDTVKALHPVTHPPAFQSGQDPMYLVEHEDDYFQQVHTDDILALITISFESQSQKKQKIRTLWCPHKATRIDILHFLKVVWYCRSPTVICFVYWNGALWPESDQALRTLAVGDHLRLVMRSDGPNWYDIEFSQGVSRDTRIFESSPEPTPPHDEEEDSPPSPHSIRSRSRERRSESRQDEDSDSLLQLREAQAVTSLLQISHRLIRNTLNESPQEVVDPHVSDRWCVKQQTVDSLTVPEPWTGLGQGRNQATCQQTWDFKPVIKVFEHLDTNFTLPCFVFPEDWPWKGPELQWKDLPFFDPSQLCHEMVIYSDGSAGKESAGAAAIIFCKTNEGWTFGGAVSLQLPTATSFCAEQWGTIIAAKTIYDHLKLQEIYHGKYPHCTILFDSQSAGYTATGHWGVKGDPQLQRVVRSICHLVSQRFGVTIQGEHVAAHRGDPGNEFADNVAEQARFGNTVGSGATGLWNLVQTADVKHWEWIWFLCKRDHNIRWTEDYITVSYNMGVPGAPCDVLNLHHIKSQDEVNPDSCNTGLLDLTMATANVLTLKAGMKEDRMGLRGPARQQVVYKQFHEQGIHVVAIQESRIRQKGKTDNPWYIVRQAEANQQGCYGVQLLFHKSLPIGHDMNNTECTFNFQEEEIRYMARDPRFLIVKVNNPMFKAIVIAAHAPHKGAPEPEIEKFWRGITDAIPQNYATWDKVVLTDANSHLGTIPTASVGAHQAEHEDEKSTHFHHFLVEHELWLPCTFEETQEGEGGTWWNDKTKKWQRNDYIAVVQGWKGFCKASVNEDIDLSLQKDDHRVAQLRCVKPVTFHSHLKKRSRRWDVEELTQWASSLTPTSIPPLDNWNLDVHSHAQALENTFEWYLQQHVRPSSQIKRKTHLSDETWNHVLQKRKHRRELAEVNDHDRLTRIRIIFEAWKEPQRSTSSADNVGITHIVKQLDLLVAGALQRFQVSGREVTKQMRKDDNEFYLAMAAEAGNCDRWEGLQKLWKRIRGALPKNKARRANENPLQCVSLDDQWHPYFHQLEAGEATEAGQLQQDCLARQHLESELNTPLVALPSLCDVEDLLRKTHSNRAPGLSDVPTAFYHHSASAIGQHVFDLFLKVYTTGREPLQWKGGILAPIYKRGPWDQADSYRAIMLLPSLAKRFHAFLRLQLCQQVTPHRPEGVLGGFPHQEGHFGAQYLRTRNAIAESQKKSFGVLFIDIKNAFHNVIREQLTGVHHPELYSRLLDRLQLAEDVKEGLRAQENVGILHALGVPQWMIGLLAEVHQDTWYTMRHDGNLHKTGRGTRPGSPIADLCFHVLMIDMMKEVEEKVKDNIWLTIYAEVDRNYMNVIWADDIAIPCQTQAPEHLPLAIKRIAQMAGDTFRSRGFALSFAKGKTSAVLALRGSGAPTVRGQYLLGQEAGVVLDEGQDGQFLHFVPHYKHLGVQFVASNDQEGLTGCMSDTGCMPHVLST